LRNRGVGSGVCNQIRAKIVTLLALAPVAQFGSAAVVLIHFCVTLHREGRKGI